jgi:hypothetical protein
MYADSSGYLGIRLKRWSRHAIRNASRQLEQAQLALMEPVHSPTASDDCARGERRH